ncbi:hypothetical protein DFP72DRAFT_831871 [Ephemerocybe angulata]|uniref:HTH CENPB-type domain-containing protein n=1 Tax=Ephemerocybe angulata TaxID=980116 RepID=A0A8H6H7Q5_9AGAR|nr:hypothetical protein DFP72DRAFT_831871 [Tulosesus angulatus]
MAYSETGKKITLSHGTLCKHVNGGTTIQEFNTEKSHLSPGETDVVIKVLLELASWGYPFSYLRLKEHVNQILRAQLGDKFPEKGVGVNWARRFRQKHADKLQI